MRVKLIAGGVTSGLGNYSFDFDPSVRRIAIPASTAATITDYSDVVVQVYKFHEIYGNNWDRAPEIQKIEFEVPYPDLTITQHPTGQTVGLGETISMSCSAASAWPVSYAWKKDGALLGGGGRIAGVATQTLTITDSQMGDTGSYTCVATDQSGSVESNPALVWSGTAPPGSCGATTGIVSWLVGDRGITSSAGDVSLWGDQSSLGNDASQPASGVQPSVGAALNGRGTVFFDGTDEYLDLPAMASHFTNGGELFVVMKHASAAPSQPRSLFPVDLNSGDFIPHFVWSNGYAYDGFLSTVRKVPGNPTHDISQWRVVNIRSQDGEYAFEIDGSVLHATATNTFAVPRTAARIGRGGYHSNYYFNGNLAEICLFNRVLTDGERAATLGYLQSEWGL